jgi:glycosyltransferase involved in cell wall biosynthesis
MKVRATVIIPTFGNAKFARWAIKSVQRQTVQDIEICIICDGSPEDMISFFKDMEKEDPRLKVFVFPKSPRTGEPYRDIVIKQTTGNIICYCGHDDLWLPHHIEEMKKSLKRCCFTHSLHTFIHAAKKMKDEKTLSVSIQRSNLKDPEIIQRMLCGENFFGLTYGAHTRKSYNKLEEGWVTTPRKDIATDLYMWRKFLSAYGNRCKTTMKVTALNFQHTIRKDWSEQERDGELKQYFEKIQDPAFLREIDKLRSRYRLSFFYQKIKNLIKNSLLYLYYKKKRRRSHDSNKGRRYGKRIHAQGPTR